MIVANLTKNHLSLASSLPLSSGLETLRICGKFILSVSSL